MINQQRQTTGGHKHLGFSGYLSILPFTTLETLAGALEVPAGERLKSIQAVIRLTHLFNGGNIKYEQ